MIKRFCDNCGEEIKEKDKFRFIGNFGKIAIEIQTGTNAGGRTTWNSGDFCYNCIVEAVNEIQKERRAANGH